MPGLLDLLTGGAGNTINNSLQQYLGQVQTGFANGIPQIEGGYNSGIDALSGGLAGYRDQAANAQGSLRAGLDRGQDAYDNSRSLGLAALAQGRDAALGANRDWFQRIEGYYDPYLEAGGRASDLYSTALGLNGAGAASQFYADYGNNDPFRAYRDEQANRAILAQANAAGYGGAGGMSGLASGAGGGRAQQAVANASLARGTDDLNRYLDRLSNQSQIGQQAAGSMGNFANAAAQRDVSTQNSYGTNAASLEQTHGNNIANMYNTWAGRDAGVQTGVGQAFLTNSQNQANAQIGKGTALGNASIGYGQLAGGAYANAGTARAQANQGGINNLFQLAATGLRGYSGMPTTTGTQQNAGMQQNAGTATAFPSLNLPYGPFV